MDGVALIGWLLAIAAFAYVLFIYMELRRVWRQLQMIRRRPTNAEIQLTSKSTVVVKLALEINELLRENKETYQEMQRSSEQFDIAINNIAHDLRTPLTVATGYSQYLGQNPAITQEQQADLLGKINVNLKDVENKLEELLTYNRIAEQQVVVNLEQVNVSKVLEEQLFNYFDSFQEQAIELAVSIEPNVTLVTDGNLVSRMMQNALGNMLHHGEVKGEIDLRLVGDQVIMRFSNQTPQAIMNHQRLFDRFYTEDLSRKGKNAGLGLYIIKELTTLLEGEVTLTGTETQFDMSITLNRR